MVFRELTTQQCVMSLLAGTRQYHQSCPVHYAMARQLHSCQLLHRNFRLFLPCVCPSCRNPQEAVDLPLYLFDGNVDARAAAFVADLLDDDEDEAELPALAKRTPIVLAAAVQS